MSMIEIFLSKSDFERIANGHELKIKISGGRGSRINGIILKPDTEHNEDLNVSTEPMNARNLRGNQWTY